MGTAIFPELTKAAEGDAQNTIIAMKVRHAAKGRPALVLVQIAMVRRLFKRVVKAVKSLVVPRRDPQYAVPSRPY